VFLSGAQRAPQTNLPRAFGHAGQHDIHDDDSADHQENGSQANGDHEDVSRQLFPQTHDGVRADDSETISRVPGLMAPGAQEHARFVLGGGHHLGIACLHEKRE